MKVLVVIAHPLESSLCHALAREAIDALAAAGHQARVEDLYGSGFSPALTAAERASYYAEAFAGGAVKAQVENLLWAEGLVLCFPTWWFMPPAVLKGWFDRVWAPGSAYDHATDLGAIRPRLRGLRRTLAITTLGAPGWVDWLVMRRPVRRVLKTAILGTCAPKSRFEMLSLYKSERVEPARLDAFRRRIAASLADWR
jgi:NAD(P)H dehydrogenase (quinone)